MQANVSSVLAGGHQVQSLGSPVNSLAFSKNSEFICAGLGDGITKIWSLQDKRLVANLTQPVTGRYNSESQFSPITSISLNNNNQLLASSNQRGIINIYRTEQFFEDVDQGSEPINIKENYQIQSEQTYQGAINQVQFSYLVKDTLGSVTHNGAVCLHNVHTKQLLSQFNKHSGYVRGISFSPLNKLLMCSVGLDRQIIFYDINDKLIVKKI